MAVMRYSITNIECCEPTELRVSPDVEVWDSGSTSGGSANCALVHLVSTDRTALVAYLVDQWGSDDETGGWTSEKVAGIEELPDAAQIEWGIYDHPTEGTLLATVTAPTAIEALDLYACNEGFARYSDLIRNEVDGERWLYYTEDLVLGGPFTNYEVFAVEVG